MSDLHTRFGAWLADGAAGEPPRDVALHASGCETCLRQAAGIDALTAIDLGTAPLPPLRVPLRAGRPAIVPVARAMAGVSAVALVAAAGVLVTGALLDGRAPGDVPSAAQLPSQGEGVLAAEGGPSPTATPTERTSATAGPSASATIEGASPEPSPTERTITPPPAPIPATATPAPAITPRPTAPPTSAPTPAPTQAPTPTPIVAPPTPTPAPPIPTPTSPQPTPTPTPEPTPTQSPEG